MPLLSFLVTLYSFSVPFTLSHSLISDQPRGVNERKKQQRHASVLLTMAWISSRPARAIVFVLTYCNHLRTEHEQKLSSYQTNAGAGWLAAVSALPTSQSIIRLFFNPPTHTHTVARTYTHAYTLMAILGTNQGRWDGWDIQYAWNSEKLYKITIEKRKGKTAVVRSRFE